MNFLKIIIFFLILIPGTLYPYVEMQEFCSEYNRYCLKIIPSPEKDFQPGQSFAALIDSRINKQIVVWRRFLISNQYPTKVIISFTGEYVVTIDQGTNNIGPLVIYGKNGELITIHTFQTIFNEKNLKLQNEKSINWEYMTCDWLRNIIIFFDEPEAYGTEKYLFIRLRWNQIVIINLKSGTIIGETGTEQYDELKKTSIRISYTDLLNIYNSKLPKVISKLLDSKNDEDIETVALTVGEIKLFTAIPYLKDALKNNYISTHQQNGKTTEVFEIRKAAKKALESLGVKVEGIEIERQK